MTIYTIMVCETLEETNIYNEYGCQAVVGFFADKDKAIESVIDNYGDLHETVYNYACIERVEEGVFHPGELVAWFKYNRETKKYDMIPTPDFDKHICGRTIG